MIDIIMGYDCDIKCDYCTITDEMRPHSLTTAQIRTELARGRADGHREVQFGGGEPTLRADLAALAEQARRLGFETIKVQSHGLRYADPAYVDRLIRAGVNVFAVSVMSHLPDLYEKITGYPHALDRVLAGLGELVARGQDVVADVIMKRDTYEHLPGLVDFYAERGLRRFVLWLVSLTDQNAGNARSLVPVATLRPFIEDACRRGRAHGVSVLSRHIPRCQLIGLEEHLWDVRQIDNVWIVTPDGSFHLHASRITANRFAPQCERCVHRPRCMGVRADYLDRFGDSEIRPILEGGL